MRFGNSFYTAPPKVVERNSWGDAWRETRIAPWTAKFGLVVIAAYIFLALFAPVITPLWRDPRLWGRNTNPGARQFILGTDNLGRDMSSRV